MRKFSLFSLLLTLCLTAAALTGGAAAAGGIGLEVSSTRPSVSQTVGFTGLPDNCQSFQATFTLSHDGPYTFTADADLDQLPGFYTVCKQEGSTVTVYVVVKTGSLTQGGKLPLGTLHSQDNTAFTVEQVTDVKAVDAAHNESSGSSTPEAPGQDDATGNPGQNPGGDGNGDADQHPGNDDENGGADETPDNSGNGDAGQDPDSDDENGSAGQTPDNGGNSGTTVTRPITLQSSTGGRVTASAAQAAQGQKITLTVLPDAGYVLSRLSAVDSTGKQVNLTESNGKYIFSMPASAVTVTAVFEAQPSATPQAPFTDVVPGSWYADAVQYVFEQGLMGGTGSGQFSPDLTTSRAMIVTILYRLEGSPTAPSTTLTDVAPGQWYSDGVAWANANGIVTGYPDGRFGPEDTITREQMAAILYRYARYKGYDVSGSTSLDRYTDAGQVSPYAAQAMNWVVSRGIITGTSATTLSPAGSATRAQAAVILARFCQDVAN